MSATSSNRCQNLFSNNNLALKFIKEKDSAKSKLLLAGYMKILNAKIETLKNFIVLLEEEEEYTIDVKFENSIVINLDHLQDEMNKIQTKAKSENLDLKPFTQQFLNAANVHIIFHNTLSKQNRLDKDRLEKTIKNFEGMKKGKYANDMLNCILLQKACEDQLQCEAEGDQALTKKLFNNIKGSKTAMESQEAPFSSIYNPALRKYMRAIKQATGLNRKDIIKMNNKIMAKMSDEKIKNISETEFPRDMEKIKELKNKQLLTIETAIENSEFEKIKQVINTVSAEKKQEITRNVLVKHVDEYLLADDLKKKTELKNHLLEILKIGNLPVDEKKSYEAILED